jgi:hypothetical protein
MSLRIKLTARRCPPDKKTTRVRYEHGEARLIPEELVRRRWRERTNAASAQAAGVRFDGCRLPPGTWILVGEWLQSGLQESDVSNAEVLARHLERTEPDTRKLRTPHVTKLAEMLGYLQRKRVLRKILARQRNPANPGLPDLFLYKVDRNGRVIDGRFVEVKRWDRRKKDRERVSPAQKAELAFLIGLRLKAQVVYLLE